LGPVPILTSKVKHSSRLPIQGGEEEPNVPESWQPTLDDITRALTELSDRVAESKTGPLDRYVYQNLRDIVFHLEFHIPGLETPPDADAAGALARAARAALERGDEREALTRALRGLSFAPHDPVLFYTAASACFELGAVELALRLLYHTLWIHPGHKAARADLASLSAFLDDTDEAGRAA